MTIIELEEEITVLNNVTTFYKIPIKSIQLREQTTFQMVNFHKQGGNNYRRHGPIWTIIKLEEDIMVLNNVTKFHKILTKTIRLKRGDVVGQTYASTYIRTDRQG